jgi:hypothetical protein
VVLNRAMNACSPLLGSSEQRMDLEVTREGIIREMNVNHRNDCVGQSWLWV